MRFCLTLVCITLAGTAWARRQHHAHEHGAAELGLLAEGHSVQAHFESPAESIYGFEHEAKTPEQKATQQKGLDTLKNQFLKLVQFPAALNCKIQKSDVHVETEGEHKDAKHEHAKPKHEDHASVEGTFVVRCEKPVAGAEVNVNFTSEFPRIKQVHLKIISGTKQEAKKISSFPTKVHL